MPYSKSNKEIQNSAFAMRSGNTTPFKEMGSSPVKQITRTLKKPEKKGIHKIDPKDSKKLTQQQIFEKYPHLKPKGKSKQTPNIVSEPVTTNVNMPNTNLKIDDKSSESTIRDVLQTIHAPFIDPNKTIRTTQNVVTKVKKKVGESYRKSKKTITNFLNKTI